MNNLDYLLSPQAIRERCQEIYAHALTGGTNFILHENKIADCAGYVLDVIYENYPDLNIPFHSRWRHFKRDVHFSKNLTPLEQAKEKWDCVVPSVLLDAGAGMAWKYFDKQQNSYFTKSEGLALASLDMFDAGHFKNAESLLKINAQTIKKYFQVSDNNPLIGIDGRVSLLQNLGRTILNNAAIFKTQRVSDLIDIVLKNEISAPSVLKAVLHNLGPIWPGRIALQNVNLGDVWLYPPLSKKEDFLVPFHKLSQWLTYSLLEPLIEAGYRVIDVEKLTGLSEYRNGGLFLDFGVCELKDASLSLKQHAASSELIIEWRALTVCLLDKVGKLIQEKLHKTEQEFPLAKALEGGTWWAGRKIAKIKRVDGGPPLQLLSDGTVF